MESTRLGGDKKASLFKSLNEHGEFDDKEEIIEQIYNMAEEEMDLYSIRDRLLSEFHDSGIFRKKGKILLLGPSKSGKSTTLDNLIHYQETKWNKNPELSDTTEIRERIYRYESDVKDENNQSYFIEISLLDFPGFFDNRGKDQVMENYQKIFKAICNMYNDIICIIFCVRKDAHIGAPYFVEELKYFKDQLRSIKEEVGSNKEIWKKTVVLMTRANANSDDSYCRIAMEELKYDTSMSLTDEQREEMIEVAWQKEIEEKSRAWQQVFMEHMDVTPLVQPIENSKLSHPTCEETNDVILKDGSLSNVGFWKCIKDTLSSHSRVDLISTVLCLYPPKPVLPDNTSLALTIFKTPTQKAIEKKELLKTQMKRTMDQSFHTEARTWSAFFSSFCSIM